MPDRAAVFALASAACLAFALVLARRGLRARPVIAAAATSVPTATALMWLASPVMLDTAGFNWTAVTIFAACGVLFPIGVTLLSFATNRLMGPALAGALANTTPLFALAFAALMLGEIVTLPHAAGALIIILGVALLTLPTQAIRRDWPLWTLVLPLATALIRGIVQPGIKAGLAFWPSPFAASLVGYTVSSLIILTLRATQPRAPTVWPDRAMFMLVGIANAAAVMLMYAALAHGPVTQVAPLVATYPIFTIALSALMLRGEMLHPRLLLGVTLTVLGVVAVLGF